MTGNAEHRISAIKALNLGCGLRFHPDWMNIDLHPATPAVRACDLRKGIPFSEGTFDLVYHSHVLEHFPRDLAVGFIRECYRVLKPGGIVRVVVPDLERIARLYLEALEKASAGLAGWDDNYEWMVLEMFDQAVRHTPGGACLQYLQQKAIPNWNFVHERWGAEATAAVISMQVEPRTPPNGNERVRADSGFSFRDAGKTILRMFAKTILSENTYQALKVGRFRNQGEIHHWMYDTYSLAQLLRRVGFRNCQRRTATESEIRDWANYRLDSDADGATYKPDSLFMEAVKP